MSDDRFASSSAAIRASADYGAHSIEVLEWLEPVRRRPGMYVGGTDERPLHHEPVRTSAGGSQPVRGTGGRLIVAKVTDNSMDEAVPGYASAIRPEV